MVVWREMIRCLVDWKQVVARIRVVGFFVRELLVLSLAISFHAVR